jgi:hypothetical protein
MSPKLPSKERNKKHTQTSWRHLEIRNLTAAILKPLSRTSPVIQQLFRRKPSLGFSFHSFEIHKFEARLRGQEDRGPTVPGRIEQRQD